jgi:hypothetical protein
MSQNVHLGKDGFVETQSPRGFCFGLGVEVFCRPVLCFSGVVATVQLAILPFWSNSANSMIDHRPG